MGSNDYVLVIGSAHVDVIGDFNHTEADRIDKEGKLLYAVGGVGFNIAINLRQTGVSIPTALYTILKQNSFSADWIMNRLETDKVIQNYVQQDPDIHESGFVAHTMEGALKSAVSSMAIEHWVFTDETLVEAIGGAKLVVLDCNLSHERLQLILSKTCTAGKPVVVEGVSESKARRVLEVELEGVSKPIGLFVVNQVEAECVFGKARLAGVIQDAADKAAAQGAEQPCVSVKCEEAKKLCHEAKAWNIVVTMGQEGHIALSYDGKVTLCTTPKIVQQKDGSSLGAGDAFCAAITDWLYHNYVPGGDICINWNECHKKIERYVQNTLSVIGATRGATDVDVRFCRKEEKIIIKQWEFWKLWGPIAATIIAAVFGAAGVIIAAYLQRV